MRVFQKAGGGAGDNSLLFVSAAPNMHLGAVFLVTLDGQSVACAYARGPNVNNKKIIFTARTD
jgi:hypothetical protein